MSVTSIISAKWDRTHTPDQHSPREALEIALHKITSGEIDPKHVVVVFGELSEDGHDRIGFYQSGTYRRFGQIGMMRAAELLMWEADA